MIDTEAFLMYHNIVCKYVFYRLGGTFFRHRFCIHGGDIRCEISGISGV